MKKMFLVILAISSILVGCSKINDNGSNGGSNGGGSNSNNLIGTWSSSPKSYQSQGEAHYYRPNVIIFENDNTVVYYGRAYDTYSSTAMFEMVSLPGHSGWYYYEPSKKIYTYSVYDNKVYVPSAGDIYTIEGGSLYLEGTNDAITRWY